MKVKLVKSTNPDSWYTQLDNSVLGQIFNVQFSESASQSMAKNVYEILNGKFKGKLLEVKDTKILVNV